MSLAAGLTDLKCWEKINLVSIKIPQITDSNRTMHYFIIDMVRVQKRNGTSAESIWYECRSDMVRVQICIAKTSTTSRAFCIIYFEMPFKRPSNKFVNCRLINKAIIFVNQLEQYIANKWLVCRVPPCTRRQLSKVNKWGLSGIKATISVIIFKENCVQIGLTITDITL